MILFCLTVIAQIKNKKFCGYRKASLWAENRPIFWPAKKKLSLAVVFSGKNFFGNNICG
jgi:hypothetical protein